MISINDSLLSSSSSSSSIAVVLVVAVIVVVVVVVVVEGRWLRRHSQGAMTTIQLFVLCCVVLVVCWCV